MKPSSSGSASQRIAHHEEYVFEFSGYFLPATFNVSKNASLAGGSADNAIFLFKEEFKLHVFGRLIDYPLPVVTAWLSGVLEILLPILLVIGFATRLSAFGLLIMTAMIQITVPDGWANFHLPWAAMAMAIMSFGPGKISLDQLSFSF
jgi:uncharacterized membrane protein YphA (DoxX/SURF4 family)